MLRSSVLGRLMLVLLVGGFLCSTLCAADDVDQRDATRAKMKVLTKNAKTTKLTNKAEDGADEVDLFQAIEDGQIEVGVVQNEMKKGKLFVQNKTDKPLCVKIPDAFGTRPVLAQMGGGGMGQNEQLLGNSGIMNQGGGNFMNVPAEKVMAVPYKSVCLEYGKPEPKSSSVYEIAPIEEVTDKEEVKMICTMLNQVDQRAAQFAVWHISSGVPMEKLASETVLHANGKRTTNFSQKEAMWGAQIVKFVQGKVAEKQNPQQMTPEQEDSMFQNYVPGGQR